MHLATLLIQSLFIDICIFLFFLTGWWTRRNRSIYGWISASAGLVALGFILLLGRDTLPDYLSIWLANVVFIFAETVRWAGARSFDGRRLPFVFMVAGPIAWTAACLVPPFYADIFIRIGIISLICGTINLGLVRDLLLGWRREPTGARAFYIAAVIVHALFNFARVSAFFEQTANAWSFSITGTLSALYILESSVHLVAATIGTTMLERDRAEAEQRHAASTDVLTGALSRRAFFEKSTEWIEGKQKPATILVFDLDHFKVINDVHSHAGGDAALVAFSELVKRRIDTAKLIADFNLDTAITNRYSDWYGAAIGIVAANDSEPIFGRIGGEEFACLLPHLTREQAFAVAEELRSELASLPVMFANRRIKMSFSCGLASTADHGPSLDTLLSLADQALYLAKRKGRNRVEIAVGTPDSIAVRL